MYILIYLYHIWSLNLWRIGGDLLRLSNQVRSADVRRILSLLRGSKPAPSFVFLFLKSVRVRKKSALELMSHLCVVNKKHPRLFQRWICKQTNKQKILLSAHFAKCHPLIFHFVWKMPSKQLKTKFMVSLNGRKVSRPSFFIFFLSFFLSLFFSFFLFPFQP